MATEVEIWSDAPRRGRVKKGEVVRAGALSGQEAVEVLEATVEMAQEPAGQASESEQVAVVGEVMLTVLRVCPNPRLLLCTYTEDGREKRALVRVSKANAFFRRGMTFLARPSANESEVWAYTGRLPRFPGRW